MDASFKRNGRELSHEEKLNVVQVLQTSTKEGARLDQADRGTTFKTGELKSKKTGRVGRKQRYKPEDIVDTVAEVPKPQRSTLRDIMDANGISLYNLHKNLKAGTIQRRSSRLKPLLNDANKLARIAFCYSHVRRFAPDVGEAESGSRDRRCAPVAVLAIGVGGLQESESLDMYDVVHLDEKWFNTNKDRRKGYLVADETPDRRACKSKRYIPKVMFLAAVTRPRGIFDGKIGMRPYVTRSPAVRTSRNRPTGTCKHANDIGECVSIGLP
ncbi:Aste57867_23083 [Aphanomyces stellatus]|uniref:Aste57867_23083 protein n=1 Tax=Aphanomyces stellatus TaxID=120398 RepID=A0A485LRF7_9STRA|nr:hypothetical protein As57867_023012 [Aphanomyces stellatus]VFT99731.1 Aste57867_23083 [Aphanomyces stellatus]